ncbi:MarR family transcriptional regulator [Paenibacillus chitinolyticus]|uniref:MarR family transcriptional regulator n=2 Tax=Paenibacillus chitinolyticus TaxID=79263 RepID=A0A410WYF0_9BACL|nr:MarR family transcriptional regulator [Paenibacillus chitinolyticus]
MQTPNSDYLLSNCLYFTVSRFARQMEKLAEEAFASIDIPPSYTYLIITLNDYPGITQKELCEKLTIAPSTSTRFIDKLVQRNFVERKPDGKHILIYLTDEGKSLCKEIYENLNKIYLRHSEILDKKHSQQLIHLLHEASQLMEKNK